MLISHTKLTRTLVVLTTTIAAAALFSANAVAGAAFAPGGAEYRTPDEGITQHQSGGVTPTNLARAVPRDSTVPGGVTPTNLARAVPSDEGIAPPISTSTETVSSGSFADRELALGFGLGLALAIVLSLALVMSRRRISMAHS